MTHAELVARAERWLYSIGCGFVFTEFVTRSYEIPDAIGFRSHTSILVEAKTSRADFLADRKKPHRMGADAGMGDWRFFMCPPDLIKPDELPPGWGLLYVREKIVQRVIGGPRSNHWDDAPRTGSKRDEAAMMYSALRRLKIRGRLHEIYEDPPEPSAPEARTQLPSAPVAQETAAGVRRDQGQQETKPQGGAVVVVQHTEKEQP